MYDVISIGSSLVDIFIESPEFSLQQAQAGTLLCQTYGDKIEVDSFVLRTGGGGSNSAVGFARLGFRTGIVSELGKDVMAQLILDEFRQEFVMANLVISERKEQTGGSVILIGPDGGRTVMTHRGASSLLDPADIPQTELAHADWVHLSSIQGRIDTLRQIWLSCPPGRMSWNPGKQELLLMAQRAIPISQLPVEILILNQHEWQMVAAIEDELRQQIPIIVVTNGRDGGRYIQQNQETPYPPATGDAVDETGAGDAFATALVAAHIWGKPLADAVRLAAINASSVVQQVGAKPGLLKKASLLRYS